MCETWEPVKDINTIWIINKGRLKTNFSHYHHVHDSGSHPDGDNGCSSPVTSILSEVQKVQSHMPLPQIHFHSTVLRHGSILLCQWQSLSYHCSWKYGGSSGAIIFSVLEAAAVAEHSLCPVSGSTQEAEAAANSSTDLIGLGDSGEGSTSSRTGLLASRDSSFRRLGDFVIPWTYTLLLKRHINILTCAISSKRWAFPL